MTELMFCFLVFILTPFIRALVCTAYLMPVSSVFTKSLLLNQISEQNRTQMLFFCMYS